MYVNKAGLGEEYKKRGQDLSPALKEFTVS